MATLHFKLIFLSTASVAVIGIAFVAYIELPTIDLNCQDSSVSKLVAESKRKVTLNPADLEYQGGIRADELIAALDYVEAHHDYTSYHLLMNVRQNFPIQHDGISKKTRAAVLCSALRNQMFLNDWGCLMPTYQGPSALALVETGVTCLDELEPILHDESSALLWGSIQATASSYHMFRRKDFAYQCCLTVLKKEYRFEADLDRRDAAIRTLASELRNRRIRSESTLCGF